MNKKDGRINHFIKLLEKEGFIVQEGSLQYIDILKLVSEGKSSSAFGNIVGAPYATFLLPPAPNQKPSRGQKPPKGYDPGNPNNYPPNLDSSVYFCFKSYLALVKNKPEKDYWDAITAGDRSTSFYHFIGASMGDQINNYSVWTENTPYGAPGSHLTLQQLSLPLLTEK